MKNRVLPKVRLAGWCAWALIGAGQSWGQPAFSIGLTQPNQSTFDTTSANYNLVAQTLRVDGTFVIPASANVADYRALVQNAVAATGAPLAVAGGTSVTFSLAIPMSPTAPGGSSYAFSADLFDPDHVAKPILAELLHVPTGEVRARARIVLFDKRLDPLLNPKYSGDTPANPIPESLAMEVTGQGLDTLERLHKSTLPDPSASDFDARLTGNFRGRNENELMNTTFSNLIDPANPTPKACIALDQAPRALQNTAAFTQVVADATARWTLYRAAVAFQQNGSVPLAISSLLPAGWLATAITVAGSQAIIDSSCVQELPTANKFEICSGSLRGTSQALLLNGVDRVDLALGRNNQSPPEFSGLNTLGRLDGLVDAQARSLFFRYAFEPTRSCGIITNRPQKDIPESQLTDSTVNTWRSCSRIRISATTPRTTDVINFRIEDDNSANRDLEKNLVTVKDSPTDLFNLGNNRTKDVSSGLCAVEGFTHNARNLLDRFWGRMKSSLDTAWTLGSPVTQQSNALDRLLSRWETGIYGETNLNSSLTGGDLQLQHNYNSAASKNLADRFMVRLNTGAKWKNGPSPATWVYPGAVVFPCSSNGYGCLTNGSIFNQTYDVSFSVTTGALNQVAKELAASPILTFDWQPTYDDLGVTPPAGSAPNAVAVLDAVTLSQLDPAFGQLGNKVATLRVRPTVMPYTYINPQPSNVPVIIPEGRRKLTYQLIQLELDLIVASDPGPYGDNVWLRVLLDSYDPEFVLSPAANVNLNRLVPSYSSQKRNSNMVLRTSFFGCPMGTVTPSPTVPPPWPRPACAGTMGNALATKLRPTLDDRLLYLLSRFPAPLLFDAQGQASPAFRFNLTDRYQGGQVISFYGNLQ